jgi:hypothetical protein
VVQIPTHSGDVLIFRTKKTFTIHAVVEVLWDGQQEVQTGQEPAHEADYAAAVAIAKRLLRPRRRIFLQDIDRNTWLEVPVVAEPEP